MQPKYYGAAAQYNKPAGTPIGMILKFIGIGVGVIVLITVAFFAYSALTSGGKNTAAQLVAREKQLLSYLTSNQGSITSDVLRTANSNAISLLTSDSYALAQGIKTAYGLATVPDAITKAEADTTSKKTLDTAKIQSRFDRVYLELLREKVAATQQLAQTVLASSSGSLKTAVETTISHLTTVDEQLAKIQL